MGFVRYIWTRAFYNSAIGVRVRCSPLLDFFHYFFHSTYVTIHDMNEVLIDLICSILISNTMARATRVRETDHGSFIYLKIQNIITIHSNTYVQRRIFKIVKLWRQRDNSDDTQRAVTLQANCLTFIRHFINKLTVRESPLAKYVWAYL